VLDCVLLTENSVLSLQWDVTHQNYALLIMNSSALCSSLSTTYRSVINMLNELIRTIRTPLLVSGLWRHTMIMTFAYYKMSRYIDF